ncbi:MAG: hypothetical protein CMQ20_14435 [Gammaproteobacteria bacterium]|nr:hypothetical protein [Gammaproteobacteria bacterium]
MLLLSTIKEYDECSDHDENRSSRHLLSTRPIGKVGAGQQAAVLPREEPGLFSPMGAVVLRLTFIHLGRRIGANGGLMMTRSKRCELNTKEIARLLARVKLRGDS